MRSGARVRRFAAACAVTLLAACAHRPPAPAVEPRPEAEPGGRAPGLSPPSAEPGVEVGLASFYGRRFQGRRTASGTRYDVRGFTCAHRNLPFGTRLRVVDLETGRAVEVTVNDRGPFAKGRVVDLSLAAAHALGMVSRGVIRVRVERVDGDAPGT
jgi:rare lipoprotein A